MQADPPDRPHRRFDPLSDGWVLNSPHRLQRPWSGAEEADPPPPPPPHDPDCYLCPRNLRASGARNPDYEGPFAFANDYPALLPDRVAGSSDDPLLRWESAAGVAEVVCFSPDHARGLSQLSAIELAAAIGALAARCEALGRDWRCVQLFENRGDMMGASSPHPHAQIWASAHLPQRVATEDRTQRAWLAAEGRPMLAALAERELASGERVVHGNDEWLAIVPFWAQWPFELLILPLRGRRAARGARCGRPVASGRSSRRADARARPAVRRAVPLLDGVALRASRRWPDRSLAAARASLPAAAAQRERAQAHGGLRAAGRTAARLHARTRRAPVARRAVRPGRALALFRETHGRESTFLVHAPGRANLIGEHVDYNGGSVLPMAIDLGVTLACGPNK